MKDRFLHIEKSLRTDRMVEKATLAELMQDIEKICIFPDYMEVHFTVRRISGIDGKGIEGRDDNRRDDNGGDIDEKNNSSEWKNIVRIEYGNMFNYSKSKEEEREQIIDIMSKNPFITARKIASLLDMSLSGTNYRIRVLKKEGRIRFDGKGGHGKWIVEEKNEKSE